MLFTLVGRVSSVKLALSVLGKNDVRDLTLRYFYYEGQKLK